MSKLIVVVGVTGVQGSSVADTFTRLPGWNVRGITRNPTSPTAITLAARGVEIVKGDLEDKDSLLPAFEGAAAIFANTDFFGHLKATFANPGLAGDRSPSQYAADRAMQQYMNIAEAAASRIVLKTLERFVLSSLTEVSKWSKGMYTQCYHMDVKAQAIRAIKTKYPDLAARMSMVQMGQYVRNWQTLLAMHPHKQADGSFVVKRTYSPDREIPFIVTHKDTGAFVKALVVDLPAGKHILGVSESMTWPAWTKLWAEVVGVQATFERVSEAEFWAGLPKAFTDVLAPDFAFVDEFGYTGGDPEVMTAEKLGVEIPVTSMEAYLRSEDWSSVL
ncbi:hypothetical protein LTR74_011196 [Friedmanniomyces endolithicus]|nr:hypothetical protein LTR74_011196 [Friedmanniomyces endolithicus]